MRWPMKTATRGERHAGKPWSEHHLRTWGSDAPALAGYITDTSELEPTTSFLHREGGPVSWFSLAPFLAAALPSLCRMQCGLGQLLHILCPYSRILSRASGRIEKPATSWSLYIQTKAVVLVSPHSTRSKSWNKRALQSRQHAHHEQQRHGLGACRRKERGRYCHCHCATVVVCDSNHHPRSHVRLPRASVGSVDLLIVRRRYSAFLLPRLSEENADPILRFTIHEILFNYLVASVHPPPFRSDRAELVTSGVGRYTDADGQVIMGV